VGQVAVDWDDLNLGVAEEPVHNILPSRTQSSLDDDTQFNANRSWQQARESSFEVGREFITSCLAEEDRDDR
jgi:hypothetical protein